jgi:hypothetical protein
MDLFSYILSQSVHCWYIDRLLIFCKLVLYPATLLKKFMESRSVLGLIGVRSCCLQIGIV